MAGTINSMTATLRGITHTWPADIDVLLVSPTGQTAVIFSDVGRGNALNNITVTLSDSAASSLPNTSRIRAGTYKPTNVEPGEKGELDSFLSPAPAGPYSSPLAQFNGINPNGTWSLYVVDDGAGNQGQFSSGWLLTITTSSGAVSGASLKTQDVIALSVESHDQEQIVMVLRGLPEKAYNIEISDDMVHWSTLRMVNSPSGINLFTDKPGKTRFYRGTEAP